jgi:hypothetical protein
MEDHKIHLPVKWQIAIGVLGALAAALGPLAIVVNALQPDRAEREHLIQKINSIQSDVAELKAAQQKYAMQDAEQRRGINALADAIDRLNSIPPSLPGPPPVSGRGAWIRKLPPAPRIEQVK